MENYPAVGLVKWLDINEAMAQYGVRVGDAQWKLCGREAEWYYQGDGIATRSFEDVPKVQYIAKHYIPALRRLIAGGVQ